MAFDTCTVSPLDMDSMRRYIPEEVKVVKPSSNQTVRDNPQGTVAVYLDFFEQCGLRFPLTEFVRQYLVYYGVCIAQLTPNSVINLIGFEVLCRVMSVQPSVGLFGFFFYLTRTSPHWYSIRAKPSQIHRLIVGSVGNECLGWKNRFVFISEELFPKMSWKSDSEYPLPSLDGSVYDSIRKLLGFHVEWPILLGEEVLHSAKMPNVYSGPLPVTFRDLKGNEVAAKSVVAFLGEMSKPCEQEMESAGKEGTSAYKRAKLSGKFVLNRVTLLDDDNDDDEARCSYKDSGSKLNVAENYQQELNAEREKNAVLAEALEKAKAELESANKEASNIHSLTELYSQALTKNSALEEALKRAKQEAEVSQAQANNHEHEYEAEVKRNVKLLQALSVSKRELEAEKKRSANARDEADKAKAKNSALEEALKRAKEEAEASRALANNHEHEYEAEVKRNVALLQALSVSKRELEAEKKRSANDRDEADKAKEKASNLRSQIKALYLQSCSKD